MRAMVSRDTKRIRAIAVPQKRTFSVPRCSSSRDTSFAIACIFAKVNDLATCRAKAEFPQLSCPFGNERKLSDSSLVLSNRRLVDALQLIHLKSL